MTPDNPPKRRKTDLLLPKADLSDPALHTAKELRRTLRIQTIAVVVLGILLIAVAVYVYSISRQNTRALCAIRANAQDRAQQAQQFLFDHPNGIPGISTDDLNRSIQAYQATVRSLSDVDCPEPT